MCVKSMWRQNNRTVVMGNLPEKKTIQFN